MGYVITNGKTYLKLTNTGAPTSCARHEASIFTQDKANKIILSLPKALKKFNYRAEEVNDVAEAKPEAANAQMSEEVSSILKDADDFYLDYETQIKKDNRFNYTEKTFLETVDDVPQALKHTVQIMTELENFIRNMEWKERELDLQILDIRHYLRDSETRLGSVQMGKVGYMLQDLERQRAECKRNKNCCLLFQGRMDKFRDKKYIGMIDEVIGSEYRYRRVGAEEIKSKIAVKKGASCGTC